MVHQTETVMPCEGCNMGSVEVQGVFNGNTLFQTMGILVAKKRGFDLTLKSREKAEVWTNVFHRDRAATERDSA